MAIFAIGDVHGCVEELEELLGMLPLKDDSTVIMLGDYIDRGPYSRRVLETLMEWRLKFNFVTLSGNHEEMLREFLDGTNPQRASSSTAARRRSPTSPTSTVSGSSRRAISSSSRT
jgi:predicted phosphodiesterase